MKLKSTGAIRPLRAARNERGVTLVMTLLTLALMLLLGLALTMSSLSAVIVSGNYERDAGSFYLAEAGVNHALSIFRAMNGDPGHTGTLTGDLNGDGKFNFDDVLYGSASQSAGQLLTDTRYIPADCAAIPAGGISLASGRYYVQVYDDDNPQVNYAAPAAPPHENNTETSYWKLDHNNRIVVRSIGVGTSGARTVIDAVIGFIPYPAMLSEGDLSVAGSSEIQGQYGSVHTNSGLTLGGNTTIAQSATASGALTQTGGSADVGGFKAGNQPRLFIPDLKPFPASGDTLQPENYFISRCDVVLVDNLSDLSRAVSLVGLPSSTVPASVPAGGYALDTRTGALSSPSTYGWSQTGSGVNKRWSLASTGATSNKAYFCFGNIECNGGSYAISVISTGNMTINGNANFTPWLAGPRALDLSPLQPPFARVDLLFLAGTDFKLNGTAASVNLTGVIYAGEQVDLRGNGSFEGQIVARNRANVDSLITSNAIGGNFTLNFNNATGRLGNLTQIAWRQVKQAP